MIQTGQRKGGMSDDEPQILEGKKDDGRGWMKRRISKLKVQCPGMTNVHDKSWVKCTGGEYDRGTKEKAETNHRLGRE